MSKMEVHCLYDKLVRVSELKEHPKNRNVHPQDQIDRLAKILKYQGWRAPVKVSKRSGLITAGHGRLMAARHAGWKEVPVNFQDYDSDEQEYADLQADNAIALWADLDLSGINADLGDLGPDFDLEMLGMKDFELVIGDTLDPQCDEDEIPEFVEPKSKLGDIYQLGRHRLMCGDATNVLNVDSLLNGHKAHMVFTDPPYGIAYDSSKFNEISAGKWSKRNRAEMIMGDEADYNPSFLLGLFDYCKEIFIWGFQHYPHHLGRGGAIVWNKKNENEQDNPHGDFELCWSKSERHKMFWYRWGGFNNKEKGEQRLHTTQKPVALSEWFFENWGRDKTNVVDLFGGSGSTLIACEKTNRNCFMMELDPKYCSIIVARWEKYTGKQAELVPHG